MEKINLPELKPWASFFCSRITRGFILVLKSTRFSLARIISSRYSVFVLIPLVGLLIYIHSLSNGFVLDDQSQIVSNPFIHSISNIPNLFLGSSFGGGAGLQGIYYKPLMTTVFTILYYFFNTNPLPYHLFQLTIHLLNGFLVFYLLRKFFSQNISLILSLIFISHPINTEAVIYISALQDTLFLFFGLSSLLVISKQILKFKHYLLYFLFLTLSLLSKETGILFLFTGILYKLIFNRKGIFKFLASNLILIGIYFAIRFHAVGLSLSIDAPFPIMRASIFERLITIPKILFYYLQLFFFPKDIAVAQMWTVKSINLTDFFLPTLLDLSFLTTLFIFGKRLLRKSKKEFKIFLFFPLWFLLGISLHVHIIPLDATVANRWFYFPIIGLLGILGVVIQRFLLKIALFRKNYLIIFFLVITLLSVRSFVRAGDWKNGLILASHDVKINQNSFALENNLSFELINAGKYQDALIHEEKSTKLAPWWWLNWNNLGIIYRHLGYVGKNQLLIIKAEESFLKSTNNTTIFYLPYENLAETYFNFEKPEKTETFIVDASKKITLSEPLWFYLSLSEYKLGKKDTAIQAISQAQALNPNDERANQLYQGLLNNSTIQTKIPQY